MARKHPHRTKFPHKSYYLKENANRPGWGLPKVPEPVPTAAFPNNGLHFEGTPKEPLRLMGPLRVRRAIARAAKTGKPTRYKGQPNDAQRWLIEQGAQQ